MTGISGIIFILIGVILGFFLARVTQSSGSQQKLRSDLKQARQELEHYRQQVADHFAGSAELLEQLARQQQHVYQHMAEQADKLLNEADAKSLAFYQFEHALVSPAETDASNDEDLPPRDYANERSGLMKGETKTSST